MKSQLQQRYHYFDEFGVMNYSASQGRLSCNGTLDEDDSLSINYRNGPAVSEYQQ
jgi:hypothetical protein